MMENSDKLNFQKNKNITDQFEVGERVLMSSLVIKVNQVNKKQQRALLITNKSVYNIIPPDNNAFLKFLGNIFGPTKIKRKIPLITIFGVTYSNIGSEFVIHVPTEYDYRFQATDDRTEILTVLIQAFLKVNMKKMPFFFKDDFTLVSYTTTENDMKKGVQRMQPEGALLLDPDEFKKRVSVKVQSEVVFSKDEQKSKISIDDFILIKVLGRGAFGKVMLVEKKDTKELFAIKSLSKKHIMDKNQVEHTKTERRLLEQINNQFLVQLEYAFQTDEKLFFVMKFMRGGELFYHLRKSKRFPEKTAIFYASSIIYALDYLHKLGALYRDLKPENILMDDEGFVYITDFGLAKFVTKGQLAYSLVGTPEYLAPEIIKQQGHSFDADWWSLGVLIFEMIYGRPPFYSNNQNTLFKMIIENEVVFPSSITVSMEVKDLIQRLLKKNPTERLGHKNDGDEIREHPWFTGFDFNKLVQKKMTPPIIPQLQDKFDVNNFDQEFTKEEAINSHLDTDKSLLKQFENEFGGVTYMPNQLGK